MRGVLKRAIIVAWLLIAFGLSTGCNKGKDEILPNGNKLFGERVLKDGTKKIERVEYPNGDKDFDATVLPDHTYRAARAEYPNGQKDFDVTILPDGTVKAARRELSDGQKSFELTHLPDGTYRVARVEFPNGEKRFDVTVLRDRTEKAARDEFPNGKKYFDVTVLPDHTYRAARVEYPNGVKLFDVTVLPDGTDDDMIRRKDSNAPHPLVQVDMTIQGLEPGENLDDVQAALTAKGFTVRPPNADEAKLDIVYVATSGPYKFELWSVDDKLSSANYFFPKMEHDIMYNALVKDFGEPSDWAGEAGKEIFSWSSERTVPCYVEISKACHLTALILSEDEVTFMYMPLINKGMEMEEDAFNFLGIRFGITYAQANVLAKQAGFIPSSPCHDVSALPIAAFRETGRVRSEALKEALECDYLDSTEAAAIDAGNNPPHGENGALSLFFVHDELVWKRQSVGSLQAGNAKLHFDRLFGDGSNLAASITEWTPVPGVVLRLNRDENEYTIDAFAHARLQELDALSYEYYSTE